MSRVCYVWLAQGRGLELPCIQQCLGLTFKGMTPMVSPSKQQKMTFFLNLFLFIRVFIIILLLSDSFMGCATQMASLSNYIIIINALFKLENQSVLKKHWS